MVLDEQLRLRDGGSAGTIDDTEAGTTTTLSRIATTGQAVLDIRKTPVLRGLAIVVHNTAGVLTTTGDTVVVTIEGSNDEDFASGVETLITFPTCPETGSSAVVAANIAVRRLNTRKRYVRSVITMSAAMATGMDFGIFIGDMIPEED